MQIFEPMQPIANEAKTIQKFTALRHGRGHTGF